MHAFRSFFNPHNITFIGKDPILPTPFKVGELGAIALGAVGSAISKAWVLKTGRTQTVSIDLRDAAIAQRAHQYFSLNGKPASLWDPLSGFYATKDGRFIQLHCNFPHHRQGVIDVLNCADEKAAVAASIQMHWDAQALETRLNEQGLCASMVRTPEEWHNHPQAAAIAHLPPLEILKIGESPLEAFPSGHRPLSGINVLDLTRVIAGPVCARTLAEHGATVLHITSPTLPSIPGLALDTGHGKWSAHIDLTTPEGCQTLSSLSQTADVFSQAYRPFGLAEKGFSPETLSELRPGIIYVDLSAYSHCGPWAGRRGYDSLVQAATGFVHTQTGGAAFPQHMPTQSLDYVAGYLAAFGVIEALCRRATEGGSYHVRTSLVQIAQLLLSMGKVTNYAHLKIPTRDEITHVLTHTTTDLGTMEHLKPVLKLSETAPFWSEKTRPLGSDPAVWPEPIIS
jgi:crotonobetainyl-CoA:carnitine CoA-transferase CaiB-like acyl-CoA transferase